MGNTIQKKYDVPKDHTATAGHLGLWKIWPAKSKDSSGNLVSLWVFDKGDLLKTKTPPSALATLINNDKSTIELLYTAMKKDLGVMKESQGCPHLISTLEIVEESKNALVFSTERIVCSLADILNNFERVPGGQYHHAEFFDEGFLVSEMEISRAFLSLAEGLQFMHNVQRRLHLNISPESIVITANGKWKLCNFGFSLSYQAGDQGRVASPYFLKANGTAGGVIRVEPDLQYSPPEITDGGYNPPGVRYLTMAADAFSLALTLYDIYRFNLACTQRERNMFHSSITISNNDANQHLMALEHIKAFDFAFLPSGIDRLIIGMLQPNIQFRMTPNDVVNNPYFVSGNQAIIHTVENLNTKDLGTQSSQLITLTNQLDTFPPRMLKFTLLPAIGKLCITSPQLWEYALPLHKVFARLLTVEAYKNIAAPYIAQGLIVNSSVETMNAFLSHLYFIRDTFDNTLFSMNTTQLFCNCFEKGNPLLQNNAFERLWDESILSCFDVNSLNDKLIPQLCKDACKSVDPNVKIQALFILSLVVSKLDKEYIVRNILPSLKYITENDRSNAVIMPVVGCYEAISDTVGSEYIASQVLPAVLPFLADRTFDRKSFETLVILVKKLLKKLCDKRVIELNISQISFAENEHQNTADPFQGAKAILQVTRNNIRVREGDAVNSSNSNAGLRNVREVGGYGNSGSVPPPVPNGPPPPPPGGPPPPPPSLPPPPPPSGDTSSVPQYSSFTPSLQATIQAQSSVIPVSTTSTATMPGTSTASFASFTSSFGSSTVPNNSTASKPPAATVNTTAPAMTTPSAGTALPLASTTDWTMDKPKEEKAAKSGFSWFGSKKKDDKSTPEEYKPPVMPTGSSGATSNDLDVDDFLSSFKGTTNSSNVASSANSTSSMGTATSGFGSNTASGKYGNASIAPPPSASGTSSTLSLEQQLRETQEQIARLSGTLNTPNLPPVAPATATMPSYGNPTPSVAGYGYGMPTPSQPLPQQNAFGSTTSYAPPVTAPIDNSRIGNMPANTGYSAPMMSTMPQNNAMPSNAMLSYGAPPQQPLGGTMGGYGAPQPSYGNPNMGNMGGGGGYIQQQMTPMTPQMGFGLASQPSPNPYGGMNMNMPANPNMSANPNMNMNMNNMNNMNAGMNNMGNMGAQQGNNNNPMAGFYANPQQRTGTMGGPMNTNIGNMPNKYQPPAGMGGGGYQQPNMIPPPQSQQQPRGNPNNKNSSSGFDFLN